MSFSIIDGIRMAARGFIGPGMEGFGQDSGEEIALHKSLEKLVEPLNHELAEKILNGATEFAVAAEVNAFQNGFRMATRLMVECLNSENTEERRQGS